MRTADARIFHSLDRGRARRNDVSVRWISIVAGNWSEFTSAIGRYAGPAQNFVYADVDGNIGYHEDGGIFRAPKNARAMCRRTARPAIANGTATYPSINCRRVSRLRASSRRPIRILSRRCRIPNRALPVRFHQRKFRSAHRVRRSLLESVAKVAARRNVARANRRLLGLSSISGEVNPQWRGIVGKTKGKQQTADAIDQLRRWDGQMKMDAAAPLIVTLAYNEVRKSVVIGAVPSSKRVTTGSPARRSSVCWTERPAGRFPDYDALLSKSLEAGVQAGMQRQGSKISRLGRRKISGTHD